MNKIAFFAVLAALVSAPLAAQSGGIVAGKPLYASDGKRIGIVYRVTSDGTAQLIINGKLVSIPAASITAADGKFQTSLTKKDLASAG
ncbi:hypothetical protein [Sphingomonas psychrolutea]|uniref:Uncharacterized protein n=1 Tax=Sphingomonas psychrolutea TaxID=1259676 RepID=A0ABQ1G693_9SPHN|nr:hypothetical protein [Sphingomonas psychrolutea]GGA37583.1 hypothetical protein GCM10011395_04870 [Sphingomonas psychrolutea]